MNMTKTITNNIPYDMIHELESIDRKAEPKKYNALLHKLHQNMGIKDNITETEDIDVTKANANKFEKEVIELNKFGYTKQEIRTKYNIQIGFSEKAKEISKIYKKYNLKNKPKFYYKVDDTYIQNLDTIRHWGFSCDNSITKAVDRLNRRGLRIVKHKYHWGELPKGAKYILKGNINKVFMME